MAEPPANRRVWGLVVLLSLGAFFEMYDLFLTAYLAPGLVRSGIFPPDGHGLLGLSPQATFAAATFAGLFLGTILFSPVADRFGRRPIFTFSLLWYTAATMIMAAQTTAFGLDLWRFITGIGLGVELVTIDAYISEVVPKEIRVRAFALNAFIQFLGVPAAAFLSWMLVPRDPFGIAGWRWVAMASAVGAMAVWSIRRRVPESPRWLEERDARAMAANESPLERGGRRPGCVSGSGVSGEPTHPVASRHPSLEGSRLPSLSEIFRPPYRRRTIMLIVFNFFQTIGFYGFANWLPALLASNGAGVVHSLKYSFAIAIAYPLGPLLCLTFADRFQPKWQIVGSAAGIAIFGLIFARQTGGVPIVLFGMIVTFCNCAMSYSYHAYQTELFPTRVRARAVGFCYSWSRLSTVFSSFMIAFFLGRFGTGGVFAFIAASMVVVMATIGILGPPTRGLTLEEVSG